MLRRTLIDTKKCVVATVAVMEEPFSSKTVGTSSSGGRSGFGGGGGGRIGGGAPGGVPGRAPGGAPGMGGMFGGPKTMPEEGYPSGRSCLHPGLKWKKAKSPKLKRS